MVVSLNENNIRKPFNQKLHDKYDPPARRLIKAKIPEAKEASSKYDVDLLLNDISFFRSVEVEVISSWGNDTSGPFNGLPRLWERKYKRYDLDTLFVQINKEFNLICLFSKKMVNPKDWYSNSYYHDYSLGVEPGGYMVVDISKFNTDVINRYYRRIHPLPYNGERIYCNCCLKYVKNFSSHLKSQNHKLESNKLGKKIVSHLKDMLFRRFLCDLRP